MSPSEDEGLVGWYRIFRSRSDVFTDPVPITNFNDPDSMNLWEEQYTILVDSVRAGITEYIDFVPLNGIPYYFWLQAVGTENVSEKISAQIITFVGEMPLKFNVKDPYPNPFNPVTIIEYSLPKEIHVTLTVYNSAGQSVAVLKNGFQKAGHYAAVWNAPGMPSGIYFCKLKAGNFTEIKKVLLLK